LQRTLEERQPGRIFEDDRDSAVGGRPHTKENSAVRTYFSSDRRSGHA
jgi:hypothetical protein